MYCPVCNNKDSKVVDSRLVQEGSSTRRRRECTKCKYRFSTLEEIELIDLSVVKADGQRESYARAKLERGIMQSLVKRSFTQDAFAQLMGKIERDIQKKPGKAWVQSGTKQKEITSKNIGEIVMDHLKKFDKVAYIRFASIYRAFEDVETFEDELRSLLRKKKKPKKKGKST